MSSNNDEVVLNDHENITHYDMSTMYDSLFDETYVVKLDNIEMSLKIYDLEEEIESPRLVRPDLSEKSCFS